MRQGKTIDGYLEAVAEQIKWKRARPVVTQELRQHLEDQRDAFAAEGQEDPEQLAVEEMGDPVAIGAQLDGLHRPRPQWGLLMGTILLALLGTVLQLWLTATWENPNLDLNPMRTAAVFVLGRGSFCLATATVCSGCKCSSTRSKTPWGWGTRLVPSETCWMHPGGWGRAHGTAPCLLR